MKKIILLLIPLMVLFTSCTKCKINKLEKFTAKVEQSYSKYSNSDLDKAKKQYDKIVADLEKSELSGEQESQVAQLKGECKSYFAQAKARILLSEFNDAVDEAGDEVKGAIESMKNE